MTLRKKYPVGVLFFLSACVATLGAAEPSSPNAEDPGAKAAEMRSVSLSGEPAAPVETYRGRRKSIIEKQAPSAAAEPETKVKEAPALRVPVPAVPAPAEPVIPVKEDKTAPADKQIAPAPPAAPEVSTGRKKSILEKQPAPAPAPRKVRQKPPRIKPPKVKKARAVDTGAAERAQKAAAARTTRYLQQARAAYNAGNLGEAEERLDECLKGEPLNLTAQEMKSKIAILKERMLAVQEDVADDYYRNAEYFYEKGNLPEALLWIERSVKLNRKSLLPRMLHQTLQQEEANMLQRVNKSDKKALEEGVKYFLDEDFENAAAIFRELQRHYPEMNDFLSTSIIHSCDTKNSKRSREYIQQALENMKMERYKSAQENLYLALEMDTTNLYARLVLEQVNLELGTPSSLVPASARSGTTIPR